MIHLLSTMDQEVSAESFGNHQAPDETGLEESVDRIPFGEHSKVRFAQPESAAHLAALWGLADEMDQVTRVDWSVAEADASTDG